MEHGYARPDYSVDVVAYSTGVGWRRTYRAKFSSTPLTLGYCAFGTFAGVAKKEIRN
jgi:hypothetical protein